MDALFSDRISDVPKSFIREILKVTLEKDVISFAGGLPNRELFPLEDLRKATDNVYTKSGRDALQYSNTEGFPDLRKYISGKYKKRGLDISMENIIITAGSQQGLDLLGKVFINEGDDIIIEEPGYLGAIQAFSVYRASFNTVKIQSDGPDTDELEKIFSARQPKLMYTVPNFQNPSGLSYSASKRKKVSDILKGKKIFLVEDDPYGELRFSGEESPSFKSFIPDRTILLGSFSKTVVPGFRLGWMAVPSSILDKIIVAKQASDLHTNNFCQRVVYEYITGFDIESHIKKIVSVYGKQRDAMIRSIDEFFPAGVKHTVPDGGMFLWAELPDNISSMKLFDIAIGRKVAFVPGDPFYVNKSGPISTLRLNFTCSDEEQIKEGIKRLGESISELLF